VSESSIAHSEASYASGQSAFSGSGYSTDGGTPSGPRRRRSFSLNPGTLDMANSACKLLLLFGSHVPASCQHDTWSCPSTAISYLGQCNAAGRVLAKVREANRQGVMAKLEHLDERYLSKIFLGGGKKASEVEMSKVRRSSCELLESDMHMESHASAVLRRSCVRLLTPALQMASQGDDEESPRQVGGGHVTFAIGAAAGAEAALQQRDAAAAAAGGSSSAVTDSHVMRSTAVTAAGTTRQPSAQRPQPHHSALRHPAHQQLQPQQQPRPWSSMPTVRLADYTSNRSGVHQVSLCL
jgi:hypothetical protein